MIVQKEKILCEKDNRDVSRSSMRLLLSLAQNKVENGVKGSFPLDDVAKSKDFFRRWKKDKGNYRMLFLSFSFFTLFFSSDFFVSSFFLLGSLLFFVTMEEEKTKKNYIKNMIGDLSHIQKNKRDFYVDGLLSELWAIEKEKVKVKSLSITGVFLILGNVLFYYSNQGLGFFIIFVTLLIFAFGIGVIETKKNK